MPAQKSIPIIISAASAASVIVVLYVSQPHLYSILPSTAPARSSACTSVSPSWIYEMHSWSHLKASFSQGAQDFYLEKIFSVIGSTSKYFVEFGFNEDSYNSGGTGANTALLYAKGWRGLLLDGERENPKVNLHKHLLFANNIAGILAKYGVPQELDYLSVDMDSHDLWVFRAILETAYCPRVITTEYNANYPLSVSLALMDPTLVGNDSIPTTFTFSGCAWGASARALWKVATAHGYRLVGVIDRLDLVWLREDLFDECFLVPEFEWFFRDVPLGTLHHEAQTTMKFVEQIVDYDTFVKTGDLKTSNKAAREALKTENLPCFAPVNSIL